MNNVQFFYPTIISEIVHIICFFGFKYFGRYIFNAVVMCKILKIQHHNNCKYDTGRTNILRMDRFDKKTQDIIRSEEFDKKICIFARFWNTDDCEESADSMFIFGDNDVKEGLGGQAVIRNCPNAYGIPTKKLPNNSPSSFYSDDDYEENCEKIINAIKLIVQKSADYQEIIFPSDGFGTGLARLAEKAPKTFAFMENVIDECFSIDYPSIRKNGLDISIGINN
jgi:hypothetical protein